MTLFDKSLTLALIASASLLTACPETKTDDTGSTTSESDTDTDADTDADTDCDLDTGIAQFYFVGGFDTTEGEAGTEYVDGKFGYGFYGFATEDWACYATGTLPYEGDAAAGCPDCDWSFDLGPTEGSTAVGDFCDQFGVSDGALDGYFDYSWGFTPVYYYDYNGTPLPLEDSVMLYIDEWFVFAYNYNGSGVVDGDSSSLTFERPVFSGGSPVYYYYYPDPTQCD